MSQSDKSKLLRQDRLRKVVAGAAKHLDTTTPFTLTGTSHTVATFSQLCLDDIAASDATARARAAWLTCVQNERDRNAASEPTIRAFRAHIAAIYGDTQAAADVLADFGYTPRASRAPEVAVKAAAADKARATRKARGTLGSRQKKKVTGTVPP